MQRTKIEWVKNPDGTQGFTWNPIKGLCPMGCHYCYARKMYRRFNLDPALRLDGNELESPLRRRKPSTIFVCSTMEIFCPDIPWTWVQKILSVARKAKHHTYIFLSKMPSGYNDFSILIPMRSWLGVTITGREISMPADQRPDLVFRRSATVYPGEGGGRFVSFEPLLYNPDWAVPGGVDWYIVGAMTQPERQPPSGWVKNIIARAYYEDVPIFMKDNLKWPYKIQEFPDALGHCTYQTK